MVQEDALKFIIEIINTSKIPYMLVGAFAVNYYSSPRLTHDADLVIQIDPGHIQNLVKSLGDKYYIDSEMIKDAITSSTQFNLIHFETGFKIDFWVLKEDKLSQLQFSRRISGRIFGQDVFIISPEDLVLTKLSWFKETDVEKHFLDALGVYRMQKDILDLNYLSKYVQEFGLEEIYNQLEKEV